MGHKPPNQKSYYCHNHFSSTTVYRPIIIKMSEWKTVTKNTYLKSVEQKRHIIETIQCRNEWKQKNVRSLKSPTLRFILTLSQLSRLTDVLQIHICLPWRIVASETSMVHGECFPCCTNIVQNNGWNQSGTSRRTWFVLFSPSIERLHLLWANVVHDIWRSQVSFRVLYCECCMFWHCLFNSSFQIMNPLSWEAQVGRKLFR